MCMHVYPQEHTFSSSTPASLFVCSLYTACTNGTGAEVHQLASACELCKYVSHATFLPPLGPSHTASPTVSSVTGACCSLQFVWPSATLLVVSCVLPLSLVSPPLLSLPFPSLSSYSPTLLHERAGCSLLRMYLTHSGSSLAQLALSV